MDIYQEFLVLYDITIISRFEKFINIMTFNITIETGDITQPFTGFALISAITSDVDISN